MHPLTETCDCRHVSPTVLRVYVNFPLIYGFLKFRPVALEELGHIGMEKSLVDDISRSLRDGKNSLKTEYQKNCKDNESSCPCWV